MKNINTKPESTVVIPTYYPERDSAVVFKTTLLHPLPDGEYVVPSTLPKDADAFEMWETRFALCNIAMDGLRDFVFLELVVVENGIEYWTYGT